MNENASMGKLVGVTLTLAVAVILIATVMVPVLSDAQKTAGDEITMTNSVIGFPLSEMDEAHMTIVNDGADITYTINGVDYTKNSYDNSYLLASDGLTVELPTLSNSNIINIRSDAYTGFPTTSSNHTITIDCVDGTITLVVDGTTRTYSYTWLYVIDEKGDYFQTMRDSATAKFYVKSVEELSFSGRYTTGDNPTYYALHEGEYFVSSGADADLTYSIAIADGTTDIFEIANLQFKIGDESFYPYILIGPAEVTGHKSSGAGYSLYGVIPVIVLVSLLGVAISTFRSKDY